MRLFSYVVTFDTGFAPNPFWGFLTLACCKPKIRLTASPGDLVVGLAPSRFGSGVVYVARIDEKMTFHQYWQDPRFEAKRPRADGASILDRCGDNIYQPVEPQGYRQLHSAHSSKGGEEDEGAKHHDLSGRFVLASSDFSYFGAAPIPLPDAFRSLIVKRGHRSRFPEGFVAEVDGWRRSLPRGVQDRPQRWRDGDESWRETR
jgi:hypothetical protein